jgi:hypothetical protein
MNQPTNLNRSRTFSENLDRWVASVIDRLQARNPNRPVFDRDRFLAEMEEDHPHLDATPQADRIEAALAEARGNAAAFEQALFRGTMR